MIINRNRMEDLTKHIEYEFLKILRRNKNFTIGITTANHWDDVVKVIDSLNIKYTTKQLEFVQKAITCSIRSLDHVDGATTEEEQCNLPVDNGSNDSQKCEQCGGRTALVKGRFYYSADAEPYVSGIEEEVDISGDCWVGGFVCEDCNNVQGLWHE